VGSNWNAEHGTNYDRTIGLSIYGEERQRNLLEVWGHAAQPTLPQLSNQVVNTNLNTTYTIPWLFLQFSTLSGTTAPGNNTPHVLSLTMSIPGIYCLLALD